MPDLEPYVEGKDYVRVRAFIRGFQHDAVVLGWRGDRMYLTWRSDMGNHLGWVAAADVERCG
jgi:hypothetical protein